MILDMQETRCNNHTKIGQLDLSIPKSYSCMFY